MKPPQHAHPRPHSRGVQLLNPGGHLSHKTLLVTLQKGPIIPKDRLLDQHSQRWACSNSQQNLSPYCPPDPQQLAEAAAVPDLHCPDRGRRLDLRRWVQINPPDCTTINKHRAHIYIKQY